MFTFVPTNGNDNSVATYWEGASGFPSTLTVSLGANAALSSIVVKLNPDSSWGPRTQTIEVLGRGQSATTFSTISPAFVASFAPASGNTVTIPVSATVADVQLRITTNSGAPAGQVAEFQIFGTPAPNPDLTITGSSWSPANPIETDTITATATVRNNGTAASGTSNVNFYLGTTLAGTASVAGLAAGATANVSASLGTRDAASYQLTAKVDEANTVVELNDDNNSFTNGTSLVVSPVPSSDLVAAASSWSPSNPSAGNTVTFSVAIKNQGTVASASGAHGITLTVINNANGSVVRTLTGSYTGAIAPGATTAPINLGTWTAANGKYTVRVVLAVDANELAVKQGNNTTNTPFFVGRGANMPYDSYEAEDGVLAGGASLVGPNRTIGDLAGEASGRKAVRLNSNGASVEFTTRASTNTLVTRFSIPDSAGGGGTTSTLSIYVNNVFLKAIDLTSKYAWLYGNEAEPNNSPGSGGPRHIYDEASIMLGTTVPAGSKIKLQKDAANGSRVRDRLHQPGAGFADRQPGLGPVHRAGRLQPAGRAERVRPSATGHQPARGLPAAGRLPDIVQVAGERTGDQGCRSRPVVHPVRRPDDTGEHRHRHDTDASANGSTFSGFAYFGNYPSRINGPGKVFNFGNVSNMTIDNIWIEHDDVHVLGSQHRLHHHQELPHPRHDGGWHQHDQREHRQPGPEHRGPVHR